MNNKHNPAVTLTGSTKKDLKLKLRMLYDMLSQLKPAANKDFNAKVYLSQAMSSLILASGDRAWDKIKLTKAQKAWLEQYQSSCFDLEPMYLDEFKDGERTFQELMDGNIQWTRDHFAEIIANLERLKPR